MGAQGLSKSRVQPQGAVELDLVQPGFHLDWVQVVFNPKVRWNWIHRNQGAVQPILHNLSLTLVAPMSALAHRTGTRHTLTWASGFRCRSPRVGPRRLVSTFP
jgi:hypothetical protein